MLTRWIMKDGETELIERVVATYGNPIDFNTPLPHEVEINDITNESELETWIIQIQAKALKFYISKYCPNTQRNIGRLVIRFADPKIAIEFKLRIEY